MMAGNPSSWWSMQFPAASHEYVNIGSSTTLPPPNSLPHDHHHTQDLPVVQSWSQLLLGGLPGEEERFGDQSHHFQQPNKKLEIWENQILNVKQEISHHNSINLQYDHGHGDDEIFQASSRPATAAAAVGGWSQMIPVSSPTSCITSLNSSNTLDFSYNNKAEHHHASNNTQLLDHSSECNSTARGGVCKKARVQPSSSQPPLKVRKEKLGDRITALHQMVSPFGKTDTASVLLEAIGYIRFLQGQIEALSSPYLGTASPTMRNQQSVQGERNCAFPEEHAQDKPKDLRSRGLCLVPVSCTQQVGSDNGADYWAPAFGGGGSGF